MSDTQSHAAAQFEVRPKTARWTHIALRVADIDRTIEWYSRYTPLELLGQVALGRHTGPGRERAADDPLQQLVADLGADRLSGNRLESDGGRRVGRHRHGVGQSWQKRTNGSTV